MTIEYAVKRKRIESEGETYWPGDVVPGAGGWRNLRAYVGAGILVPVEFLLKGPYIHSVYYFRSQAIREFSLRILRNCRGPSVGVLYFL